MNYNQLRITYQSSEHLSKDLYDQVFKMDIEKRELKEALENLLNVINLDKDRSFFICEEASEKVKNARKVLNKYTIKEPCQNFGRCNCSVDCQTGYK